MGGFPSKGTLEFFLAGNENRGIAGTARTEFARDLAAGDALRGIDDFQDREAAAVADVERLAGNLGDFLKRADVGVGDIEHVDIVADAGSVGRGIVRAEDIDAGKATAGRIENAGDNVSLHAMMLAALLGASSSVEIAQGHLVESGVGLVITQNPPENDLEFSVGVEGVFAMICGKVH